MFYIYYLIHYRKDIREKNSKLKSNQYHIKDN